MVACENFGVLKTCCCLNSLNCGPVRQVEIFKWQHKHKAGVPKKMASEGKCKASLSKKKEDNVWTHKVSTRGLRFSTIASLSPHSLSAPDFWRCDYTQTTRLSVSLTVCVSRPSQPRYDFDFDTIHPFLPLSALSLFLRLSGAWTVTQLEDGDTPRQTPPRSIHTEKVLQSSWVPVLVLHAVCVIGLYLFIYFCVNQFCPHTLIWVRKHVVANDADSERTHNALIYISVTF